MRINLGTYENQEEILNKQINMIDKQTDLINKQVNLGTKVNQTTIINNQTTIIQNQKEIKSLLESNNIIEDTHIVSVLLSNTNELSVKWALKSDRVGNAFYLIAKNEGVVAEEVKEKKFADIINSSTIMNKIVNSTMVIEIISTSQLNKEFFSSSTVITALRNSRKTKRVNYDSNHKTIDGKFLPICSGGGSGSYKALTDLNGVSGGDSIGSTPGAWLLNHLSTPIAVRFESSYSNTWVEYYDFNA